MKSMLKVLPVMITGKLINIHLSYSLRKSNVTAQLFYILSKAHRTSS